MRLIVVTGGDEFCATALSGLAASLNACRTGRNFATACLDHGLTPSTREGLASRFDSLPKAEWPFRAHAQFATQPQARRCATQPFLPDRFPGYDAYVWIDPHNFVQDPRAFEILAAACADGFAGVVPAIDRSYRHTQATTARIFGRFRMAFGKEAALQLVRGPYLASGVVAASAASPLWKLWQSRFQLALDRWDGPVLCAQAVLNHVARVEGFPHHKLPSLCNWQSHLALPQIDVTRGVLVEPSYPFEPIYIVANSFDDPSQSRTLTRCDGGQLATAFSFEAIRDAPATTDARR